MKTTIEYTVKLVIKHQGPMTPEITDFLGTWVDDAIGNHTEAAPLWEECDEDLTEGELDFGGSLDEWWSTGPTSVSEYTPRDTDPELWKAFCEWSRKR